MATYHIIGQPIPRVDGAAKAIGHARYAADVSLPGTLWGKSLHSPYAHARIVRIDTTAARQLPGVHAVITGADVRAGLWGRAVKDVPVLAYDRVRFVGERVAAVAADDEDIAQSALDLIEVEYEELPAVFEPHAALQDDAPILHPDFNNPSCSL
jgi:CO/xanthine dehydrogenase Mo-binding subunit